MRKQFLSSNKHVSFDAPLFHIVPYITGGYKRLMHLIKTKTVPELQAKGCHTNVHGHFDPKFPCLIGMRYQVHRILETKGQSAVIVLAEDVFNNNKDVVIKVLHTQYYQLGSQECNVLWKLATLDPLNWSHTLRLLCTLTYDDHYCLVFEPLLPHPITSVFEQIPKHRVLSDLKKVGLRTLSSVGFLHLNNMIHTDLKPENILLKEDGDLDTAYLVDFGSTINCVYSELSFFYKDFKLQTPLYRAPEVIFGMPFGQEIDIWSLGCVFAELYTGEPLFLGNTTEEIVTKMSLVLGPFPTSVFRRGKYFNMYKKFTTKETQGNSTLKLLEYLGVSDVLFGDLIAGMLRYNPDERMSASQAARHPFFASCFPVALFIPSEKGCESSYPPIEMPKEAYNLSPHVAKDIQKLKSSTFDFLSIGTVKLPILEKKEITVNSTATVSKLITPEKIKLKCEEKAYDSNAVENQVNGSEKSLVRTLIMCKDTRTFSKNVKDKMSSQLRTNKEEQELVEQTLCWTEITDDGMKKIGGMRNLPGKKNKIMKTVLMRPLAQYGSVKQNMDDQRRLKTKITSPFAIHTITEVSNIIQQDDSMSGMQQRRPCPDNKLSSNHKPSFAEFSNKNLPSNGNDDVCTNTVNSLDSDHQRKSGFIPDSISSPKPCSRKRNFYEERMEVSSHVTQGKKAKLVAACENSKNMANTKSEQSLQSTCINVESQEEMFVNGESFMQKNSKPVQVSLYSSKTRAIQSPNTQKDMSETYHKLGKPVTHEVEISTQLNMIESTERTNLKTQKTGMVNKKQQQVKERELLEDSSHVTEPVHDTCDLKLSTRVSNRSNVVTLVSKAGLPAPNKWDTLSNIRQELPECTETVFKHIHNSSKERTKDNSEILKIPDFMKNNFSMVNLKSKESVYAEREGLISKESGQTLYVNKSTEDVISFKNLVDNQSIGLSDHQPEGSGLITNQQQVRQGDMGGRQSNTITDSSYKQPNSVEKQKSQWLYTDFACKDKAGRVSKQLAKEDEITKIDAQKRKKSN